MFGFKPMVTGSPVTISSNGTEPMRFDSMSKASTSTGIPYVTLLYAKRNFRQGAASVAPGAPKRSHQVRSNGKEYTIIYHQLKCHTVISKGKLQIMEQEWESVPVVKPSSVNPSEN